MAGNAPLSITDRFLAPLLSILLSLLGAFVGSVVGCLVAGFLVSLTIVVFRGIAGNDLPLTATNLALWLEASTFYTLGYGMFGIPVAVVLIITCGLPAALVGWKLKLIQRWTCVLVGMIGGVLSIVASAWVHVHVITRQLLSSAGYLPASHQTLIDLVSLWVLGSSGALGGLCFWLALRSLYFPDIQDPVAS